MRNHRQTVSDSLSAYFLRLRDPRDGAVLDAVMFQVSPDDAFPSRLRAAYALTVNDWNGRQTVRLILRHVEAAQGKV